jgi:hypothetical protein
VCTDAYQKPVLFFCFLSNVGQVAGDTPNHDDKDVKSSLLPSQGRASIELISASSAGFESPTSPKPPALALRKREYKDPYEDDDDVFEEVSINLMDIPRHR